MPIPSYPLIADRTHREDLALRPAAIARGFRVVEKHPHEAAVFEFTRTADTPGRLPPGEYVTWLIRDGWQTARLADGRYGGHHTCPFLFDALTRLCGRKPVFVEGGDVDAHREALSRTSRSTRRRG
jgi:hypothetical protein